MYNRMYLPLPTNLKVGATAKLKVYLATATVMFYLIIVFPVCF